MPEDTTSSAFTPMPAEPGGASSAVSKEDIKKYGITASSIRAHPKLVVLIIGAKSMDDEEKKYWFHLLPDMTAEQIDRLKNILETEKNKLAAIDEKYQKRMAELKEQENIRREEEAERARARTQREEAERQAEAEEKKREEEILRRIEEQ